MKRRKTFAICRAVAAVVAAFALAAGSGFSFVTLLRQPVTLEEGADMQSGTYVEADLFYIMDICGVERTQSGKAVAYYAVAPIGNSFVLVRLPASDYDDILLMETETMSFLKGESSSMSHHLTVTGAVVKTDAAGTALLQQWFEDNAEWMSDSGVIAAVEDYSVYLGGYTIESGRVSYNLSYSAALIMNLAALALLLYAVVEFVLVGMGVYSRERGKNKKKEKPAKTPAAPSAAEAPKAAASGSEAAPAGEAGDGDA